jgi:hypothetical protein
MKSASLITRQLATGIRAFSSFNGNISGNPDLSYVFSISLAYIILITPRVHIQLAPWIAGCQSPHGTGENCRTATGHIGPARAVQFHLLG